MYESLHGFLHLDHPVAGEPVAAGLVNFRGWAAGPLGVPLPALQLRWHGRVFPAIHGFPRSDLVAHYGLKQPFLPAGFEATLDLPAGEQVVVIEALTLAGIWQALCQVVVKVEGSSPPSSLSRPPIDATAFARSLKLVLRKATTQRIKPAADSVAATLPQPVVLRYPHRPFHGHLDQPAVLQLARFGRVCIAGWLFHETATVRRVVASVDLQTWQDLKPNGPTPHVAALHPAFPASSHSGIHGWIDIPAQLPAPLDLRTYAELADGSWHLCHVQRTRLWDDEQEKAPFAPFSRFKLFRATLALYLSIRARGFILPRFGELRRTIGLVQEEYHRGAAPASQHLANIPLSPNAPEHAKPAHVTLVSHNLKREGAPLLLWEFGRYLLSQGVKVKVLSPEAGPLSTLYGTLGITVETVDTTELTLANTLSAHTHALANLAQRVGFDQTDLVVANTLPSYWAVHLAHQARRPSLFCIHESTTPTSFFHSQQSSIPLPAVEDTFRLATHVTFPTDTTRIYYRPWLTRENHSVNPSWIDVAEIDQYLATHPRDELRERLGLGNTERLVVNIGILCDRKGQHIFARSVDLLWRRHPALAATCQFLMVGGRDTSYDQHLQALLRQLDRPNLQIVPATDAPLDYYGAADLAVCTSYEESFPRVVMEAMASHVPIVSSRVHGINDMLVSGTNGWLVPPGDTHALAESLHLALSQHDLAREFCRAARSRVVTQFNSHVLFPRHFDLACRTFRTALS